MRNHAALVRAVVLLAAALGAASAAGAKGQATLRIVRPAGEATVHGADVLVELAVEGAVLGGRARNGAYALLVLDDAPPVKSLAPRFTFRGVRPGEHTLVAQLRRPDGSRFEPDARAEVRFRSVAPRPTNRAPRRGAAPRRP